MGGGNVFITSSRVIPRRAATTRLRAGPYLLVLLYCRRPGRCEQRPAVSFPLPVRVYCTVSLKVTDPSGYLLLTVTETRACANCPAAIASSLCSNKLFAIPLDSPNSCLDRLFKIVVLPSLSSLIKCLLSLIQARDKIDTYNLLISV